MKESTRVLTALGAAIALGIAIGASGNTTLVQAADTVAPLGTLWVNAIRMTVIPLVVSLLITGVASANDVGAVGRLGGRTLIVFLLLLTVISAIVIPLAWLVFTLLPDGGAKPTLPDGAIEAAQQLASGGQTQTVAAWLTSLIPTNPLAAAVNGAMLQLVLFTVLFAVAVSRIDPASRATILAFFKAVGNAMLVLVRWVILLAPIGVFALVLPLTVHTGAGVAGGIGFYIVAYSVLSVVTILLLYPIVAFFGRIGIGRFAKAALPSQLIAFSSSSSIASLPALVESAEKGLGLRTEVTGFVLPLAVSTFKIAGPVSWTVGALFVGWFYGVPLHARELAIIGFATVFLAFGVPGVPRGAFIMLAPLFVAIGLPIEGIGILIAVDAIPDTFATALNVTGDLAATAIVANGEQGVTS
ncbi:MAG: dicarboxylate/amino acid:cation symporter [Phycisphaerae bacterium]|nr:dicarboxylate/amino acid:cation symporter [Gemmatimonadaceae bacterium]